MVRLAGSGVPVALVIATGGELGRRAPGSTPGPDLAVLRRAECDVAAAACSASGASSTSASTTRAWPATRPTLPRARSAARRVDEVATTLAGILRARRRRAPSSATTTGDLRPPRPRPRDLGGAGGRGARRGGDGLRGHRRPRVPALRRVARRRRGRSRRRPRARAQPHRRGDGRGRRHRRRARRARRQAGGDRRPCQPDPGVVERAATPRRTTSPTSTAGSGSCVGARPDRSIASDLTGAWRSLARGLARLTGAWRSLARRLARLTGAWRSLARRLARLTVTLRDGSDGARCDRAPPPPLGHPVRRRCRRRGPEAARLRWPTRLRSSRSCASPACRRAPLGSCAGPSRPTPTSDAASAPSPRPSSSTQSAASGCGPTRAGSGGPRDLVAASDADAAAADLAAALRQVGATARGGRAGRGPQPRRGRRPPSRVEELTEQHDALRTETARSAADLRRGAVGPRRRQGGDAPRAGSGRCRPRPAGRRGGRAGRGPSAHRRCRGSARPPPRGAGRAQRARGVGCPDRRAAPARPVGPLGRRPTRRASSRWRRRRGRAVVAGRRRPRLASGDRAPAARTRGARAPRRVQRGQAGVARPTTSRGSGRAASTSSTTSSGAPAPTSRSCSTVPMSPAPTPRRSAWQSCGGRRRGVRRRRHPGRGGGHAGSAAGRGGHQRPGDPARREPRPAPTSCTATRSWKRRAADARRHELPGSLGSRARSGGSSTTRTPSSRIGRVLPKRGEHLPGLRRDDGRVGGRRRQLADLRAREERGRADLDGHVRDAATVGDDRVGDLGGQPDDLLVDRSRRRQVVAERLLAAAPPGDVGLVDDRLVAATEAEDPQVRPDRRAERARQRVVVGAGEVLDRRDAERPEAGGDPVADAPDRGDRPRRPSSGSSPAG